MTDRDKFIALLQRFGYTERLGDMAKDWPGDNEYVINNSDDYGGVHLGQGKYGYNGFACVFRFDKSGKFLGHGCNE